MAIVENRATENGDVIIIKTNVPVVGIVSLLSFVDSTENESETIYFQKKFRYSTNGGMTYSDWIELTTINIQNIIIERIDYFICEYRYKRIGAGYPDLAFNDIQLDGTYNPLEYPAFNDAIFSYFFTPNGVFVLGWALNVLEKLYKRGIVPAYVTRNVDNNDNDYIAYWFAITHFFAILVYYARQFENISSSVLLMREFVKGRGVYMRNNPDTDELYYVFSNYILEIQKRGTRGVFQKEGNVLGHTPASYYYGQAIGGDLIYTEADGELLRLLDYIITDEFLFALTSRGELGWCIGQSSPLYTGADNITNLIKGYEFGEDVLDIERYSLINSDYVSLINSRINITNIPNGEVAGVGIPTSSPAAGGYYYGQAIGADLIYNEIETEDVFIIDPTLDYEISFKVEKSEQIEDLSFGVALFDVHGDKVSPSRITDGVNDDRFFEVKALNKVNTEYWVRGVLYAYNHNLIAGDKLNVGFGQNLRSKSNVICLCPVILVENNTGGILSDVIKIRDIKVRPAALWFSRGMLSTRNFIIGFIKNRSVEYNNTQVEKIINEELIPYNSFTKLKFL